MSAHEKEHAEQAEEAMEGGIVACNGMEALLLLCSSSADDTVCGHVAGTLGHLCSISASRAVLAELGMAATLAELLAKVKAPEMLCFVCQAVAKLASFEETQRALDGILCSKYLIRICQTIHLGPTVQWACAALEALCAPIDAQLGIALSDCDIVGSMLRLLEESELEHVLVHASGALANFANQPKMAVQFMHGAPLRAVARIDQVL